MEEEKDRFVACFGYDLLEPIATRAYLNATGGTDDDSSYFGDGIKYSIDQIELRSNDLSSGFYDGPLNSVNGYMDYLQNEVLIWENLHANSRNGTPPAWVLNGAVVGYENLLDLQYYPIYINQQLNLWNTMRAWLNDEALPMLVSMQAHKGMQRGNINDLDMDISKLEREQLMAWENGMNGEKFDVQMQNVRDSQSFHISCLDGIGASQQRLLYQVESVAKLHFIEPVNALAEPPSVIPVEPRSSGNTYPPSCITMLRPNALEVSADLYSPSSNEETSIDADKSASPPKTEADNLSIEDIYSLCEACQNTGVNYLSVKMSYPRVHKRWLDSANKFEEMGGGAAIQRLQEEQTQLANELDLPNPEIGRFDLWSAYTETLRAGWRHHMYAFDVSFGEKKRGFQEMFAVLFDLSPDNEWFQPHFYSREHGYNMTLVEKDEWSQLDTEIDKLAKMKERRLRLGSVLLGELKWAKKLATNNEATLESLIDEIQLLGNKLNTCLRQCN